MVNGQNMDPSEMHLISYSTKSDARKRPRSHNDIMALRMKNRERQRRYRARKRLEADMNNYSVITLPTQHDAEFGQNGNVTNLARRVYCKRDWKKDARRANPLTDADELSKGPSIPATRVENQIFGVADSIAQEQLSFVTSQSVCKKQKYSLDRRDWKAEARNKKNKEILLSCDV